MLPTRKEFPPGRARLASWASALCLALLALAGLAPAAAAERIDLDAGWQFRTDRDETGESLGWTGQVPPATRSVDLPHTWNVGTDHDFLGVAWYFRRFDSSASPGGAQISLHFGATNYSARAWLNGVEIGTHDGGFTAYSFDISSRLRSDNLLVVRVDNRPGAATIPGFAQRDAPTGWYDWWTYGGLVRDVWLERSGPAWIERQAIRTRLTDVQAAVSVRVIVQCSASGALPDRLRVTAFDPQGAVAARQTLPLNLAPGRNEIPVALAISKPQLWDLDHPLLYRLHAELLDGDGTLSDDRSDGFGLRAIEIRDRHLLLNGERLRLTGITRHEDSPWEGLAETRGTMLRDLDDMQTLHTRLSRPVHYPQHPFILDYADRHGILLIPEIPVWQFSEQQLADPRVLALAQRQMAEMIEEAGNHPSIFAWSVANESATSTPGGRAYFRAMRDGIRKLDPDRFVTFADDNLAKLDQAQQSAGEDADFLLMNEYYGSWHGPQSALAPALDRVDALFPQKMVIISEFGYAGLFSINSQEADRARSRILQEQLPALSARDWIAGVILWCYQDYKSHRNLWPGQTEGYVDHGLVDEARRPRPSYEIWKNLTAATHLEAAWTGAAGRPATGFDAVVVPNGPDRIPYRKLRDARLDWTVLDEKGQEIQRGSRSLPALLETFRFREDLPPPPAAAASRLLLRLLDGSGQTVGQFTLSRTGRDPSAGRD